MTEGGEKQPYRLPGRAYMVMYHMFASGVWTGCEYIANMYRVWSNRVCRLREGWLYRDHQEVGLWCAEDGREQFCPKAQRKILFFDYVRFLRFLCFLSFLFAQRNNCMSVEGRNGREWNRRYCLGRVGLIRHLWGGLDWLDTYVVVTISSYVSSQLIEV